MLFSFTWLLIKDFGVKENKLYGPAHYPAFVYNWGLNEEPNTLQPSRPTVGKGWLNETFCVFNWHSSHSHVLKVPLRQNHESRLSVDVWQNPVSLHTCYRCTVLIPVIYDAEPDKQIRSTSVSVCRNEPGWFLNTDSQSSNDPLSDSSRLRTL